MRGSGMGPAGQAALRAALGGRPAAAPYAPAGRPGRPCGPCLGRGLPAARPRPCLLQPRPTPAPDARPQACPPAAAGRPPAAGKRAKPVSAVRSTAGPAAASRPLHKPANFPLSGAVSLALPVPICYNRSDRPPRGGKIRLEVRLWACSIKDPPAPSAAER